MSIAGKVKFYAVVVLVLAALYGVCYAVIFAAPRLKRWVSTHTTAKAASMANMVIDGLSGIAQTVVTDFNQRVVNDAKSAGTWTPALAASVKQDAVKAVLDQGSQLIALGKSVVGNIEGLVPGLVEQAVAHNWMPAPIQPQVAQTQPEAAQDAATTATA